jgi:CAI-1 autoinducer synthase
MPFNSPIFDVNPPLLPMLLESFESKFLKHWNEEWGGKCILHGKPTTANSIHLDGNDYLSIAKHPDIISAQVKCLENASESVIQSGAFLLDEHPSRYLEKSMAAWMGKEDGFLTQSGYTANIGLLQAIANKDTPVYIDTMAHTSLWEGAHAARAPAYPFRHNDPEHLAKTIARYGSGIVIVDSVYSTTGAICPLEQMVQVCEAASCMILVDESHSLGTHGPGGAGLCVALGLSHRVHFITTSLAKAFAGRAGFFTVPAYFRFYVLHHSFPSIFSSCLLPHEIAGISATLEVIKTSDAARTRLHSTTKRLRATLTSLGYPIHQGTEQIISLEAGTEPDTMYLRDRLEEHDVVGAIFCAPATSRNRAMVRLTVNAGLSDDELTRIETAAEAIAPQVKPWDWPIVRRAKS